MDLGRKADARPRHQHAKRERVAVGTSADTRLRVVDVRDAAAVIGNANFRHAFLAAEQRDLGQHPIRIARQYHLVDLHLRQVSGELGIIRATSEDFLGHCAGRIPRSRAHRRVGYLLAHSRPTTWPLPDKVERTGKVAAR
jgi:hypothetical protein